MKIHVRHETHYTLESPASRAVQYLRLTPRSDRCQRLIRWSVRGPASLRPWTDGYGNHAHIASEPADHKSLTILVDGVVETWDTTGILPLDDGLPPLMFLRETHLTRKSEELTALKEEILPLFREEGALPALHRLMAIIFERIIHEPGTSSIESTAAEVLVKGRGVCQDHAHVFIAVCRMMNIAARYVSGYLAVGTGALASHAWAEAYVPDLGWVSFDPTNRQCATDSYVRLAVGVDYASASPVVGVRSGGSGEDMAVDVEVIQIQE